MQVLLKNRAARVVEWLMAPGCKPGRRKPYIGSNPIPCTSLILDFRFWIYKALSKQLKRLLPSQSKIANLKSKIGLRE